MYARLPLFFLSIVFNIVFSFISGISWRPSQPIHVFTAGFLSLVGSFERYSSEPPEEQPRTNKLRGELVSGRTQARDKIPV